MVVAMFIIGTPLFLLPYREVEEIEEEEREVEDEEVDALLERREADQREAMRDEDEYVFKQPKKVAGKKTVDEDDFVVMITYLVSAQLRFLLDTHAGGVSVEQAGSLPLLFGVLEGVLAVLMEGGVLSEKVEDVRRGLGECFGAVSVFLIERVVRVLIIVGSVR